MESLCLRDNRYDRLTSTPIAEKRKLKLLADGVVCFEPTEDELYFLRDGGVAIVDQWIASHGKYFIGMKCEHSTVHVTHEHQRFTSAINREF